MCTLPVSSEIISSELDVANGQFLGSSDTAPTGVECGLRSSQSLILERMQGVCKQKVRFLVSQTQALATDSLSSIIQTKEEDFSVLVQQSWVGEVV